MCVACHLLTLECMSPPPCSYTKTFIMWTELRHSGIFEDVAQWNSLASFLDLPSVPLDEYESIQHLPQLDLILEVLTMVRIALHIPMHSMSRSRHTVANRYELHRCRITSYLLIWFLQRLICQNHGYIPPFFEVLHFYKTSLLCEVMRSTFADMKHLRSLRTRYPDLCDFIQDPGHHQQPCVYIRLSPWHSPYYIDAIYAESTLAAANIYNFFGDNMPSLNLRFTIGSGPTVTGFSVQFQLRSNFPSPQFGSRRANGSTCYVLIQMLPGFTDFYGRVSVNIWLIFVVIRCPHPLHCLYTSVFRRRLHPDLHRQLRPEMLDDIQAHYSTLYRLGSNTGASFQTMRDLLSAAFPSPQLYYFLRLSTFVNEPFRFKAQKLLAQVMRKRHLQVPTTRTQLLLPPLHVRKGKAQLGTWLQSWVASHRDLFPSLFLPKIRVVETRSATLGDRIYNYRKWQRRWNPDTLFPCRCLDIDDCNTLRAHT